MIEGLCLFSSTVANPVLSGIFIAGTDAHLVIRENVIGAGFQGSYGIYLWGVQNVQVESNLVEDQDTVGIRLRGSADNVVANNTVRSSSLQGVQIDAGSTRNVVEDNHVSLSVMNGVYVLNGAHGNVVRNNLFEMNRLGVRFFNAHGNLVADNGFINNHWGVFNSVVSSGNIVEGNNFEGSREYGVENNVNVDVDARSNWWGCPVGPGADGCDGVAGRVVTSPWLYEPNPDAGPRWITS